VGAISIFLIYCVERKLTLVDGVNRNPIWQAEETKKPGFFLSPDQAFLFSIDDEDAAGYPLH
jgi:hypothetical protein